MLQVLKLHSLSWPPGGDSSGCIEVYASCVNAAFSLLTTRGLLWLYRSLYNDSTSLLMFSLSKHCKHEFMSQSLVSSLLLYSLMSSFILFGHLESHRTWSRGRFRGGATRWLTGRYPRLIYVTLPHSRSGNHRSLVTKKKLKPPCEVLMASSTSDTVFGFNIKTFTWRPAAQTPSPSRPGGIESAATNHRNNREWKHQRARVNRKSRPDPQVSFAPHRRLAGGLRLGLRWTQRATAGCRGSAKPRARCVSEALLLIDCPPRGLRSIKRRPFPPSVQTVRKQTHKSTRGPRNAHMCGSGPGKLETINFKKE